MTSLKNEPYLSVAVYSRNDDHGGDMYRRMRTTVHGLLAQAERHRLRMELVLVDYNPPQDKPPLMELFDWPSESQYCSVRVVVVPPSIHQRYEYADKLPVHGAVAYNTAIRRARGKFVLGTSIDILFPDELMKFLASETLDPDRMYRLNRHDVKSSVLEVPTLDEQLAYCRENVIRVNGYDYDGRRWEGTDFPRLHSSASGDFILLSRERWHELRGYAEEDITAPQVDGVLCYSACLSGATQEVLREPIRIYHIDHSSSWKKPRREFFEPLFSMTGLPRRMGRKADSLVNRLALQKSEFDKRGLPFRSDGEYRRLVREMIDGKRPTRFNDEDWGLGNEELPEYDILSARSR